MQVSVEAAEGLTRRVKVDLSAEEIEQEIEKRLQNYARGARLPGFRPGKVPMRVLRQRYGESVRMEVLGERIQNSLPQAIAETELKPAGQPDVTPDMDLDARRYGYTAEFEIIPEVSLNSLEGQVVKRPVAEVTESDVDATIERLREQRTQWPAVERPAAEGDRVRIDFDGRVEGEPFAGGKGEDAPVDLGAGRFIPGFEEQLEGAVAGETRAVEVTFPDDYQNPALAGKAATFEVRVREVQEPVVPAVDGDFVREFGIEGGDLERFRADVRANLERELSQRMKAQLKERVMDVLFEANPIQIPAALVAQETEALRQRMLQNIGGAEIQIPDEVFADDARRRVALGLIAAEVVREQDLKPDPERVRAAVEEMASTYEEPQQVVDFYYADEQRLASIQSMVVEEMVVEHLLEQMAVEDEPMSFTQLTQKTR